MKKFFLSILLVISSQAIFAQGDHSVNGAVRDSAGTGIIYATIKLTSSRDTLTTRTDVDGNFSFSNVKSSQFILSVSNLGYSDFVKRYLYAETTNPIKVDPIILRSKSNLLKEVVISGAAPVVVKQDTVEYRASDFPVRENSVAEDVIKRLPGVEVDKEGNVTTQGKSVTRIKVNGKDYFDGDLKSATQGLPADIIEKIQIVDDYGDQANITGIREGEADKIINITIRRDRMKGSVISGVVGGGNLERYQVSGNAQFMNNERQIDTRLNLNNTNASPFNFGGGGGRGVGGGGNRGQGGQGGGNQAGGNQGGNSGGQGGGNFGGGGGFFGNNGGISTTTAGGLNYRDAFGKKIAANGSYRFMVRNTDAIAYNLNRRTLPSTGTIITTTRNSETNTGIVYHSANFNLEYALDSLNYFRITPFLNISGNDSEGISDQLLERTAASPQNQLTNSFNTSSTPSLGGNFIYNHRFRKLGRNFSIGLTLNDSDTEGDQDVNNVFGYYEGNSRVTSDSTRNIETSSNRFTTNANITYSEPVGKFGRLDFGYNYSLADYENARITQVKIGQNFVRADNLSNVYDYSFITNRYSLNYRFERPSLYNFTLGLTGQPTLLQGKSELAAEPTRKRGFNLFPTARFAYYFARTKSLTINYNGRSQEPSFTQIQPVRDVSDPTRPIVGNPGLNSAFTQSVNLSYNYTKPATGLFFNTGIFGNFTNNQITRNELVFDEQIMVNNVPTTRTIVETGYLNADGYYTSNAYYSFGKPFLEKKYRVSLNGSFNYTNDVTYYNNQKNVGRNFGFGQNLRVQINPNPNVEIYPAVSYRHSILNYTLTEEDTRVSTWGLDLNGRIFFLKTFIVGWDVSKNINQGYSNSANPLIISTYLEKQFFNRRGTLRFQGFDLLNEGVVINRSNDANTYTDSRTNRLTRYFMATFSFRIQKFPGGVQPNFDRNRGEGRGVEGGGQPRGDRGNL